MKKRLRKKYLTAIESNPIACSIIHFDMRNPYTCRSVNFINRYRRFLKYKELYVIKDNTGDDSCIYVRFRRVSNTDYILNADSHTTRNHVANLLDKNTLFPGIIIDIDKVIANHVEHKSYIMNIFYKFLDIVHLYYEREDV